MWEAVSFTGYRSATPDQLEARLAHVLVELQHSIQDLAEQEIAANTASITAYYNSEDTTIKGREWWAKYNAERFTNEVTSLRATIRCWEIERDLLIRLLAK